MENFITKQLKMKKCSNCKLNKQENEFWKSKSDKTDY